MLVSRIAWINILFNKVSERAHEVKSLTKIKERVLSDIKVVFGKVKSWASAPIVQHMAAADPFTFLTSLADVRKWSINDIFTGVLPWTYLGDQQADVKQAMASKFAQRMRVSVQVQ